MTNVPQNLRDMWADIYRLFDVHYPMQNTKDDWDLFWSDAQKLYDKYERNKIVISLVIVASEIIEDRMKSEERQNAEKGI